MLLVVDRVCVGVGHVFVSAFPRFRKSVSMVTSMLRMKALATPGGAAGDARKYVHTLHCQWSLQALPDATLSICMWMLCMRVRAFVVCECVLMGARACISLCERACFVRPQKLVHAFASKRLGWD